MARASEFFNPYFVFCTIATHRVPVQWTESNFPSQCTAARAEFHIRSQCKARGRCAALRAAPETFSRRQPVAGGETPELRRQNCQNQNRPIFKNTGTKNFHKNWGEKIVKKAKQSVHSLGCETESVWQSFSDQETDQNRSRDRRASSILKLEWLCVIWEMTKLHRPSPGYRESYNYYR